MKSAASALACSGAWDSRSAVDVRGGSVREQTAEGHLHTQGVGRAVIGDRRGSGSGRRIRRSLRGTTEALDKHKRISVRTLGSAQHHDRKHN